MQRELKENRIMTDKKMNYAQDCVDLDFYYKFSL